MRRRRCRSGSCCHPRGMALHTTQSSTAHHPCDPGPSLHASTLGTCSVYYRVIRWGTVAQMQASSDIPAPQRYCGVPPGVCCLSDTCMEAKLQHQPAARSGCNLARLTPRTKWHVGGGGRTCCSQSLSSTPWWRGEWFQCRRRCRGSARTARSRRPPPTERHSRQRSCLCRSSRAGCSSWQNWRCSCKLLQHPGYPAGRRRSPVRQWHAHHGLV